MPRPPLADPAPLPAGALIELVEPTSVPTVSTAASPEPIAMRGSVASGIRWGAFNQVVQQLIRLAVQIVLTRLLAPHAFGVVTLAFVVINLGALLTGNGFSQALIQRKQLEPGLVDATLVGSGLLGLALTAGVAGAAGPIAHLFGDPEVRPVLLVLSLVFLFQGIEGVPNSMLRRQFMFRLYILSSTIAAVAGGIVGIALGLAGAGVWALVGFGLTEAIVATTLAWAFATAAGVWKPSFTWDLRPLRSVLGYSGAVTGNRVLFYGSRNIDNLIVGRVLGATALGYYGLAYRLMLFPIQRAADVIGSVSLSAFALMQDERARLNRAYLRSVRYLSVLIVPITVGVIVTAPHLVPVVFGPRWDPAVLPLRILAVSGPALALVRLVGTVWEASGRAAWSFWMSAIALGTLVPGFLIGVQFGVDGVAWAYSITIYLGLLPSMIALSRTTGITLRGQLRAVGPALGGGAVMAIASLGIDAVLPVTGQAVHLVVMAVVATISYIGFLWLTHRHLLHDAIQMLRMRTA